MIKVRRTILPVFFILIFCLGCVKSIRHNNTIKINYARQLLTNDSLKYWDAKVGWGWRFGKDNSLLEYTVMF